MTQSRTSNAGAPNPGSAVGLPAESGSGVPRPDPVEVQRAYALIRERIITLAMRPGASISVPRLAEELGLPAISVMEALQLLAHDDLVVITPAHEHGIYVSHVHLASLDQLSETRLRLEALSARLAAQRATADDIAVMEALLAEQTLPRQVATSVDEPRLVLEIDHRLHQAIASATGNTYLAAALERFFGLSQRLWYLVLPRLTTARTLLAAVRMHVDLLEAIRSHDAAAAERIMREHVGQFYEQVRGLLTAQVTVHLGNDSRVITVDEGSLLSGAVIAAGLPLEQPCAGRGTCGKCKTIAEGALGPLDEREQALLTPAERATHFRLACRAQVMGDVEVTLAPIVVYSDKIFRVSKNHLRAGAPLGLAIDLGSTTVAAFVSTLEDGQVCVGGAALNQQTAFGADVISRLGAAQVSAERSSRLSALARSSIVQAIDGLKLAPRVRARIRKVTIVGNCAMHHLLLGYPTDTLAELPFQPYAAGALRFPSKQDLTGFESLPQQGPVRSPSPHNPLADIVPPGAEVALPPLIGGFVGSDALACLVYYGFDRATEPMAAIDLGTNGEVMVTAGTAGDGRRHIVVASTAAGPAFEGVNISCGTRAVDGAIVEAEAQPGSGGRTGTLLLKTVANGPPVGLTGSGLLALVRELRRAGVIEPSGRFVPEDHPCAQAFGQRFSMGPEGVRRFLITDAGVDRRGIEEGEEGARVSLYLTQYDIRELQKAKGAIRATIDTLLQRLNLAPGDLKRVILTGSFGSQLDVDAALELGMIPPAPREVIEASVNGAGLGAALMLDDLEFARAERVAAAAEQVELDLDPGFDRRFVRSMALVSGVVT